MATASEHASAGEQVALALDATRIAGIGWLVVAIGVVGFLLWAALAPLDQGVAMPAKVMVAGNRKAIQPPAAGRIDRIFVHDGERVQPGQPLLRMDGRALRAEADALRAQWLGARARIARLQAEDADTDTIDFPTALERAGPARSRALRQTQRQLFERRRAALRAEVEGIEQNIAGKRTERDGLGRARAAQRRQYALITQELANLKGLAADGYVAGNRVLELEREHARLESELASTRSRMAGLDRRIAELRSRIAQRRAEYHRDVSDRLDEAQVRADELAARLDGVAAAQADTELRAPVGGRVVAMQIFTEGGVVHAADTLMEIVPAAVPLQVEARAPVALVDKLRAGLPVELAFTAFDRSDTPNVPGEVVDVSADRLVDERSGEPYYQVQIAVDERAADTVFGSAIRPGMPVQAFVRTGERTFLNYLIKPLRDRLHRAFAQ